MNVIPPGPGTTASPRRPVQNRPAGGIDRVTTRSALFVAMTLLAGVVSPTALGQPAEAEIEEIIVTETRRSESALDRKRFAINVRDTIDSEAMARFPDQDLSETLSRLPGVSIQQSSARTFRSQFITVRGIQPELNNTTILGQEIVSTQGDRSVALDLLPTGSASLIEIYKSLTPDLDANAIGGTVNMIPASAFDADAARFELGIQGGDTELFESIDDDSAMPVDDEMPLEVRGAASRVFGPDDQFGIALNGSYFQQTLPVVLNQCDSWRFAGGNPPELPEDLQFCEGQRLESGLRGIERWSVNGTAEWLPGPQTRVFVSGLYADSEEDNVSLQTEWNFTDDFENADLVAPGVVFNADGENEKELDVDRETEEFVFIAAGGEHRTGDFMVEGSASYSRGESQESVREWSFNSIQFASTADFNQERPYGQPDDMAAFNDPASFTFDEIDIEPTRSESETTQAQMNLRYDYSAGGIEGFLRWGMKFRTTDVVNDRDENQFEATPGGPLDGASLADFDLGVDGGTVFGLPLGPVINPVTGENFVAANPDALFFNEAASIDDSGEGDFEVSEDVLAGYFMGQATFGRFDVIAGFRIENTDTVSTAKVFNEVNEQLTDETTRNDYTDLFPSLQVRWEPRDDLVLRGSFTRSIARPTLRSLAGFTNIDFDNADVLTPGVVSEGRVSRGNPQLEPFESSNFDLSLEWYPGANAIVAVSGFYKDIENPIFGGNVVLHDTSIGGVFFEEVDVGQPRNAGEAELMGVELQADYRLAMLPGPLAGLGVRGNVAFMDSELRDIPGREGEELPLFQQPDMVATLAGNYEWKGFFAQLTYSYTDQQLFSVNDGLPSQGVGALGDGEFDLFRDERFELDFRVGYRLRDRYEVFAAAENVTEEPFEIFAGREGNRETTIREPSTFWLGFRASI